MTSNRVREAYGSPRLNVEGILGSEVSPNDPDRTIIEPWADLIDGQILDVGSATGRWTSHLAARGSSIEGLEPADRLIDFARSEHPSIMFHHGLIEDFTDTEGEWAGILAWYSVIHMGPEELPRTLAAFRALLEDGGSLLMSFFSGPRLEPFDHPITTAFRWPMADILQALYYAGFTVSEQHSNPPTPHAYVKAVAAAD